MCGRLLLTVRRPGEPLAVEFRAAIAQEETAGVRAVDLVEIEIAHEDLLRSPAGPGDDASRGVADKRLAGEGQPGLGSHPVAERRKESVLEGRHSHLRLEEPVGPFADGAGLGVTTTCAPPSARARMYSG